MPLPVLAHSRCQLCGHQLSPKHKLLAPDCGCDVYTTRHKPDRSRRQVGSRGDSPEAAGLAIPVQIAPLNFSVDQYIAIGSPLGLFLALRKVRLPPHGIHKRPLTIEQLRAKCWTVLTL